MQRRARPRPQPVRRSGRPPTPSRCSCCVCGVAGSPLYGCRRSAWSGVPICGLVFVSPRLTSEALQRLYDEPGVLRGRRLRRAVPLVAGDGAAADLDRGAAAGHRPAAAAARRGCWRSAAATGSSWPPPAAAGYRVQRASNCPAPAREHAGHPAGAGRLLRTAGRLRRRTSADVICFWDTLEHVPDPLAFLREVRARLAPDGVVRAVGAVRSRRCRPGSLGRGGGRSNRSSTSGSSPRRRSGCWRLEPAW